MAIRSGAAETEAGTAETSAGGGGGADSAPSPFSFWTIAGLGEVALGGLSLKDSPPCGDAAGRMGTLAAFLLLKTTPPSESSSSERTSNTLFPLSRGVGAGDEATASGTAAMGEVSLVFEVFGGYVGVVKMGLVEFRWWLVLVRARIMGGLGQQWGWWRCQPWRREQPSVLSPRP